MSAFRLKPMVREHWCKGCWRWIPEDRGVFRRKSRRGTRRFLCDRCEDPKTRPDDFWQEEYPYLDARTKRQTGGKQMTQNEQRIEALTKRVKALEGVIEQMNDTLSRFGSEDGLRDVNDLAWALSMDCDEGEFKRLQA